MNRWRVRKDGPKAWLVEKKYRNGEWGWVMDFLTCGPAIRYADRQARTIEVVLPYVKQPDGFDPSKKSAFVIGGNDSRANLDYSDLEEIGLIALAAHYRFKDQINE